MFIQKLKYIAGGIGLFAMGGCAVSTDVNSMNTVLPQKTHESVDFESINNLAEHKFSQEIKALNISVALLHKHGHAADKFIFLDNFKKAAIPLVPKTIIHVRGI